MNVRFIKSITRPDDLPEGDKPQVAFVGRSNVGKSSLINHLTGQKNLARVSSEPGRTRTINLFEIEKRYYLVDLPGYGYAKASKTQRWDFIEMLGDYLALAKALKLVFLTIDARLGPTDADREMLSYLMSHDVATVLILNKVDKLSKRQIADLTSTLQVAYPGLELIPHSSVSAQGRGAILDEIGKYT